jgi:hypothetical protein
MIHVVRDVYSILRVRVRAVQTREERVAKDEREGAQDFLFHFEKIRYYSVISDSVRFKRSLGVPDFENAFKGNHRVYSIAVRNRVLSHTTERI